MLVDGFIDAVSALVGMIFVFVIGTAGMILQVAIGVAVLWLLGQFVKELVD